jgi:hypothetical protein
MLLHYISLGTHEARMAQSMSVLVANNLGSLLSLVLLEDSVKEGTEDQEAFRVRTSSYLNTMGTL